MIHLKTEREWTVYTLHYFNLPPTPWGVLRWLIQGGTLRGAWRMLKSLRDRKI